VSFTLRTCKGPVRFQQHMALSLCPVGLRHMSIIHPFPTFSIGWRQLSFTGCFPYISENINAPIKCITVIKPIYSSINVQTQKEHTECYEYYPSDNSFKRHRKIIKSWSQAFLNIQRKILCQKCCGHSDRKSPYGKEQRNAADQRKYQSQYHSGSPIIQNNVHIHAINAHTGI